MEGSSQPAVGIAGMRERLRELGGSPEILSGDRRTKVVIKIPLLERPPVAATDTDVDPKVPAA